MHTAVERCMVEPASINGSTPLWQPGSRGSYMTLLEDEHGTRKSSAPIEIACRVSMKTPLHRIDAIFWKRLNRMIKGHFDAMMFLKCFIALIATVVNGILTALTARWVATKVLPPVFSCDIPALVEGCILLAASFLFMSTTNALKSYFVESVRLEWRSTLTHKFQHQLLSTPKVAYALSHADCEVDNVDQRMTNDIELATSQTMWFVFGVVDDSMNQQAGFVGTCASLVTACMTIFDFGWAPALGTVAFTLIVCALSAVFMPRLVTLTFRQQMLEGAYRYVHTRIREFSESITFYDGVDVERNAAEITFQTVVNNKQKWIFWSIIVSMFSIIALQCVTAFSYTLVYFLSVHTEIDYTNTTTNITSKIMGTTIEGIPVNSALILKLVNTFQFAIAILLQFPTIFANLPETVGAVHRVGQFADVLSSTVARIGTQNGRGGGVVQFADNIVSVNDLASSTPSEKSDRGVCEGRKMLFRNLTFEVKEGDSLIIMGPSGSGKTSLLRMIGGLWPFDAGTITKPNRIGSNGLFFLPQRPYITLGTLRQQLIYPHQPTQQEKTDDELIELLRMVGLIHLMYFEDGLDSTQAWADMLSGGEQQRIGFCRMFYHSPKFAIMDESTSALDISLETTCMEQCIARGITMISVGHRPSLKKFHKQLLTLTANGGYEVSQIQPSPSSEMSDQGFQVRNDEEEVKRPYLASKKHEKTRPVCSKRVCRYIGEFVWILVSDPYALVGVIVLSASIVVSTFVFTTYVNRAITGTLTEAASTSGLSSGQLVWNWVLCICVGIAQVFVTFGTYQMALSWRKRLVQRADQLYFDEQTLYATNNLMPRNNRKIGYIDNIDQRYTVDTDLFTTYASSSIWGILGSTTALPLICQVCVGLYTLLQEHSLSLQAGMILLGSLAVVQTIVTVTMIPVSRRIYTKQFVEGNFRHLHARAVEYAESICFYEGEAFELNEMDNCFTDLRKKYQSFLRAKYFMFGITQALKEISIMALSPTMFLLSKPCDPHHPPGSAVYYDLALLSTSISALMLLPTIASIFAILSGFLRRIGGLHDALHISKSETLWRNRHGLTASSKDSIRVDDLTCTPPNMNGDHRTTLALFRNLTFEVKEGDSLIIMGPSGSGKTSLLRMIGGLWPFDAGTITKPNRIGSNGLFFLPQRPYITLGTLRQQLIYPHQPTQQEKTDDELIELLRMVGLIHLMYFEDGLDSTQAWADMLSGGEQQRIGFCRMFYHSPKFAIMDESTSALDISLETTCMEQCIARGITMISVGHRPSLKKFHKQLLTLTANVGYEVSQIQPSPSSEMSDQGFQERDRDP